MQIVIIGNSQGEFLKRRLEAALGFNSSHKISWIASVYLNSPASKSAIASADVIAAEVAEPRVPPVEEAIEGAARLVRFPRIHLHFLWPLSGKAHPFNRSEPGYPSGAYPKELGDVWINAKLEAQDLPEPIFDEFVALDLASLFDLTHLRYMDELHTRKLEELTGMPGLWDFIEARYRSERLFHSPRHPSNAVLSFIADQLFGKIFPELTPRPVPLTIEHYRSKQAPVHPSIIRHFDLDWVDEHTRYRFHDEGDFTFMEWVNRYIRYKRSGEVAEALSQAKAAQFSEKFLPELHLLADKYPRSYELRTAVGEALFRAKDFMGAEYMARQAIKISDAHPEPFHLLSKSSRLLEDIPSAIKASQSAYELNNSHFPSAFWLSEMAKSINDLQMSETFAKVATGLRPDHGRSWLNLADAASALGHIDEAKAAYVEARHLLPQERRIVRRLDALNS
ncbi:WcbI family polysaccharide biosynthesis putative acetyltransferase [Maricaulis sp. D1M11]|uniref:WcbI family polysaccharide biosynthesis putative acetyltransferase n=1 Tax=Maricaulis sp. D1M11 TaxID=3076117 RepID=UPI0039B48193